MAVVSLHLADELYQRLEHLAKLRNNSLNNLFEKMTTLMLVEQDVTRLEVTQKLYSVSEKSEII